MLRDSSQMTRPKGAAVNATSTGDEADSETPTTLVVGADLLAREREFRKKNQALSSQARHVLQQAADVVKESRSALERPLTAPPQPADDEDESPTRSERPTTSVSSHRSRGNKHDSVPASTHGQAKRHVTIAPGKESNARVAKSSAGVHAVESDDAYDDAFMGLPPNAREETLGSEATTRFLKAKLHVLQGELDRIVLDRNEKDTQLAAFQEKLKSTEEDNIKANKALANAHTTTEKLKKSLDEQLIRNEDLEANLQRTRKEADDLARQSRQTESDVSARETRVNRLLEEVDKYRSMLTKKDNEAKDKLEAAKRVSDSLFIENKKLQRQKAELLAAFKKQTQLITVLKRQKMHVEAAKLLQFTEEEFMRALNWDT